MANKLANTDVANSAHMANETSMPGRNRCSATYRYRNPDKRRLYMRDLMRRKRAEEKAASPA